MFATRRISVLSSHLRPTTATPSVALSARSLAPRHPSSTAKVGAFLSTAASPADMSSAKQLVDSAIKDNNVLVFSKSYCPYCRRAKNILGEYTNDVKVYELDEMDNGSAIQQYLKELNGQGTVPHVYIRQQFIGGCSDLQAVPKAQLEKLIKG